MRTFGAAVPGVLTGLVAGFLIFDELPSYSGGHRGCHPPGRWPGPGWCCQWPSVRC